jgi:phosphotransferase system enzyme I (PtsI)
VKLNGLGVSAGIGVGRALVYRQHTFDVRFRVPLVGVDGELRRLEQARARARRQLTDIKDRVARAAGAEHAYLFEAQVLMLDDPMLTGRAAELIRDEGVNAEWALQRAGEDLSRLFDEAEDHYLRERRLDLTDVIGRLRLNLRPQTGGPAEIFRSVEGPLILVADELAPSLAAQVDWRQVAGFVTDVGSWTYHTAILARSLHVPAVVGLHDASARLAAGTTVAVDGTTGEVLVDPSGEELAQLEARRTRRTAYERSLDEYRQLPAVTLDGVHIRLDANLELPEEAETARQYGAEGVGLYRSEFLLENRGDGTLVAADEEVQYSAYRRILEAMAPGAVTVRTFDVQEQELYPNGQRGDGSHGVLGLRGIRVSLAHRDMFRTQLRALLRAARHGSLRIMFPFVTGVDEIRAGRAILAEAVEELRARGETPPDVPVGVMIEVPSAALTVDLLASESDFFSVGTNDLIQFCLAVDRADDRVSRLYEPRHPAVLRILRYVSRTARRARRPLALCGEMAADPGTLALLIGLGVTEFSMTPTAVPLAKQLVRALRVDEARRAASRALRAATVEEVSQALEELHVGRP